MGREASRESCHTRTWLDGIELSTSEESVAIRTDLESFWHQLERHFGTKSMPFDPEVKLLRFTQGNMRICDFNQKFKQLASSLDFNENRLLEKIPTDP